jgi:hypothetical protein
MTALPCRRPARHAISAMASDTEYANRLQQALRGRYVIERELGRGWMGIVYLAYEPALDRRVALKLLPPKLATSVRTRALFLREARTAARLSHPNIVPIYAVEELDEFVFFTMAYVRGGTLTDRIRLHGPLAPEEATRILREVAGAVDDAHGHGVIHRDLKPDNILIDKESGRPMVTDFGIARVLNQYDIVREGYAIGTAPFMSPEQVQSEPVDERSDVYSLGIVGYLALTGRLPFRGTTPQEVYEQHLTKAPPPLAEPWQVLRGPLPSAVERCIAKRPDDRFQTAGELARALKDRTAPGVELDVLLDRLRATVGYAIPAAILVFFAFGRPSRGVWFNVGVGAVCLALALAGAVLYVLPVLRHALKAGYRRADILDALRGDVQIRTENIAFQFPKDADRLERIAWWLAGSGLVSLTGGIGLGSLGWIDPVAAIASTALGAIATLVFAPIAVARYGRRADRLGKRLRRFLKGLVGAWLIRLAGVGLPRPPAEEPLPPLDDAMLDMSTDEVLAGLPTTLREPLAEMLETVRAMQGRRAAVRQWLTSLESRVTAHPDVPAPELLDAEDAARDALAVSAAALTGMRRQLLGARSGLATHETITAQLTAAHRVQETVDRVLAARQEVEALLDSRERFRQLREKGA